MIITDIVTPTADAKAQACVHQTNSVICGVEKKSFKHTRSRYSRFLRDRLLGKRKNFKKSL